MNILILDEKFDGKVINKFEIEVESESITVQELIEKRVIHEVDTYNKKLPEYFKGLVKPTDAEKTLNGYKIHSNRFIDGEKQVYTALNSFLKNGFFVLIDNVQVENLEQKVDLSKDTTVSFIKLTPLIGG